MLLADAHSTVVDGRRVLHTGARVGCLGLKRAVNMLGLDGNDAPVMACFSHFRRSSFVIAANDSGVLLGIQRGYGVLLAQRPPPQDANASVIASHSSFGANFATYPFAPAFRTCASFAEPVSDE